MTGHNPRSLSSSSPSSSNTVINQRPRRVSSREDLQEQGYNIGSILGEGSYCKVKSAQYNGQEMACKIINRDKLSLDFKTKFLPREINVLNKIKHTNIISIYKIFNYPRTVYIFMEWARQGDLLNYVRDRGRLKESEACRFFQQMISAMKYLHGQNLTHRDLKCENILLTDNNVIKLIDFGFSRCTVNKDGFRELSRTFCGSAAYAAPEVLQGIPYNPMMYDVWSLGCVLFIMVTGTMPFDDSNIRKMVTAQLRKQYSYPTTFKVSTSVKDTIMRMLEPDVTKRAAIRHISGLDWVSDNNTETLPSISSTISSTDRLVTMGNDFRRSSSMGTQTDDDT